MQGFFCLKKNIGLFVLGVCFICVFSSSYAKTANETTINTNPAVPSTNGNPEAGANSSSGSAPQSILNQTDQQPPSASAQTLDESSSIALPKPENADNDSANDSSGGSSINESGTDNEAIISNAKQNSEAINAYNEGSGNLWDEVPKYFQFPSYTNRPEVQAQIEWYQKHEKYFDHVLEQATPYIYYIYEQARKRDLPPELILLPIIESSYSSFDYSNKGAYGLWQIIPSTASILGLKKNWWYDGRTDLVASTNAALIYLNDLSNQFNNDWLLALAAYNCGPNAVQKAINRNISEGLPTDFWSLRLPRETENYVPNFLAVESIILDPNHYGLKLRPINNAPYLTTVPLSSQIDLKQAATMAGINEATLRKLNPGLRHWATNPEATYDLIIPVDNAESFTKELSELSAKEQVSWRIHEVSKGETLQNLAERYNTTPDTLMQVNHLKSSTISLNQQILIPVNAQNTSNITIPDKQSLPKDKQSHRKKIIYHAKSKDTVAKIADRYSVSADQIRAWNDLTKNQTLKAGQKLILWIPLQKKAASHNKSDKNHSKTSTSTHYVIHKVAARETIDTIARHYGISAQEIEKANSIKNQLIYVDQMLKIPVTKKS